MFDTRGNLTETVEMTLQAFEETFVAQWDLENSTRSAIFQKFTVYLKDFQSMVTPTFEMWIDGSFVNNKNSHPKDIDFVCFIDYETEDEYSNVIDLRFGKYRDKTIYGTDLDAYMCTLYPTHHKDAYITLSDRAYWVDIFSRTRPDRQQKKYPKGFVKIKFGNNV